MESQRSFPLRRYASPGAGRYGEGIRGTVGILLLLALGAVGGAGAAQRSAAPPLPPLPARWPRTLQIGLTDAPGGAAALRRSAPFGFRYQYLAGGVNTGSGWATWNPDGTFASMYARDSWAHGQLP